MQSSVSLDGRWWLSLLVLGEEVSDPYLFLNFTMLQHHIWKELYLVGLAKYQWLFCKFRSLLSLYLLAITNDYDYMRTKLEANSDHMETGIYRLTWYRNVFRNVIFFSYEKLGIGTHLVQKDGSKCTHICQNKWMTWKCIESKKVLMLQEPVMPHLKVKFSLSTIFWHKNYIRFWGYKHKFCVNWTQETWTENT